MPLIRMRTLGQISFGSLFGLLLLTLVPAPAGAQEGSLEANGSGELVLSQLPNVLGEEPVQDKQLTTGLTTTFYFRITTGRRDDSVGGADVSVRYDLWDEIFLITINDGTGETTTTSHRKDQLESWWSRLQLAVIPSGRIPLDTPASLPSFRVSLTVLPFSTSELADTKRWLSRTGATGRRRVSEPGNAVRSSSQLFDLLLGTSLERRALLTRKWDVKLSRPKVDR